LELEDLFERFGGHKLAGGFTLKNGKKEEFKIRIKNISQKILKKDNYVYYNGELKPEDINIKIISSLERLSPFGEENEEPLFLMKNVKIQKINNNAFIHFFQRDGFRIKGIIRSKNVRDKVASIKIGNILYTPFIDIFRGVRSVMIEIKEVF
jgi:single-stranded-DNA-specific exonuclease